MARLYLGSLVLSWITVYAFCQLVRGLRFGVVTAWRFRKGGGLPEGFQVAVDVRKESSPSIFWWCVVVYSCLVVGTPWALWQGVLGPYVSGEVAPSISFVEPIDRHDLHVSWNPPKRIDEPVGYVVYRLESNTGNRTKIATTRENTQYVDQNVETGTSYTYQVEAQFEGLTAWMLGDRPTISEPVSGTTLRW